MRIYANIYNGWKMALSGIINDQKVVVFSPYLTSKTADRILNVTSPKYCEVYTNFNVELFATGGSSIATIRNLLLAGFKVYHLPKLHAKIIYSPHRFVTIGSQNITNQGQISKELSTLISADHVLKKVDDIINRWILERQLITPEMISEAEQACKSLRKTLRKLQAVAKARTEEIFKNESARNAEKRRVEVESQRRGILLNALKRTIAKQVRPSRSIGCVVQRLESYNSYTNSLVPTGVHNLLQWSVDDNIHKLEKIHRYLCIIEDTGKLGWARVTNTRITFVEQVLDRTSKLLIDNIYCKVSLKCIWDSLEDSNINIVLKPDGSNVSLTISAWLSIDDITITRLSAREGASLSVVKNYCVNHFDEIKVTLLRMILDSFTYKSNLTGKEANIFFGDVGERYTLRLGIIGSYKVLVAKKL